MRSLGTLCLVLLAPALKAQPYSVYSIEALPVQNPYGDIRDLSDAGHVAGFRPADGGDEPWLYRKGDGLSLPGQFPRGRDTLFNGVNSSGVAAGASFVPVHEKAFTWSKATGYRILQPSSSFNAAWAWKIADDGDVCGLSWNDTTGLAHATLWKPGQQPRDLGSLGGNYNEATQLNEVGEIIGDGWDAQGTTHYWRWSESTGIVTLNALSSSESAYAAAINDVGTIAGSSMNGSLLRPTFWRRGGGPELGEAPAGATSARFNWVTNDGLFIGEAKVNGLSQEYLWRQGQQPALLTDLADGTWAGWSELRFTGWNNLGQLAGYGAHNGVLTDFLASPVPEPTGPVGLAVALACLSRGLRGRSGTGPSLRQESNPESSPCP